MSTKLDPTKIWFIKLKNNLLDLIFPKFCLGCQKDGDWLCLRCRQNIVRVKTQTCPECGKISLQGKYCRKCQQAGGLAGIIVSAHYREGPTKELIHNFKYNHILDLKELLGGLMTQALKDHLKITQDFIIVPVPLHWLRKSQRGYNQAEILAHEISQNLNLPLKNILFKFRSTSQQVTLQGKDRRKNLDRVFLPVPLLWDWRHR